MRRGLWVSFVGMDGAGKTSVSRAVKRTLENRGFKVALIYGGRGKANVLPVEFFRHKRGKRKSLSCDDVVERKEHPYAGLQDKVRRLRAWITAGVFYIDQALKYLVQIRPLRQTHDVVLIDRDATDLLLIDDVPMTLKRFLYSLVPRPSVVIYLYQDMATLSHRKKNHPLKDLQRQQLLFNAILPFLDPISIRSEDVNLTAENIVDNILSGYGI